jgi:hypothetical protein
VYLLFFEFFGDSFLFITSTQRSPFSASIATQSLRAPNPSSHLHPDVSGFHFKPESGHANARDEDTRDKREAKPEGYEALMFNA